MPSPAELGAGLPAELPAELPTAALGGSLRDHCRQPPRQIAATATVGEAARLMHTAGIGSVLVAATPFGIVTDRDLRSRVLAQGLGPETAVVQVMSQPLHTLPADATRLDALLLMAERGIRHVPLVDPGGTIVGLVSASDLLTSQSLDPLSLQSRLARPSGGAKGEFAGRVRQVVAQLAGHGVEAAQIGRFVASLNDALARRLLAEAEAELGPAPSPYAWLVYGSDGRREQLLPTDQDNALVWDVVAPSDASSCQAYFEKMASHVVGALVAEGFPLCPGGYMATRWAFPLDRAQARFAAFLDHARPETLLDACTLFDFRRAAGTLDLAPLEAIRAAARDAKRFLRLLAADAAAWPLPLGFLGGLREGDQGFDLKRGILLIVSLARLFALASGAQPVGTLDRLAATHEPLGAGDAATLAEAFRFLLDLRLDEQLGGRAQGSRVHLAALNAMERRFLKDVFAFLHQFQSALPQHFAL